MIEEVEDLRAELQVQPLRQRRVLHQRRIHVLKTRTLENVAARVSKSSWRRERERRGVEPSFRRAVRNIRISHDVWPIVRAEAEDRTAGAAVVQLRKQRD